MATFQETMTGSFPYVRQADPNPQAPSVRSMALPRRVRPAPGPYFGYKAGISPAVQPSAWSVRNGSGTTSL